MKVTLNWLKQYVDFNWLPEELTGRLTMPGREIKSRLAAPEGRQITAARSPNFFRPAGALNQFYIYSHGLHRGLLSVAAPQLELSF